MHNTDPAAYTYIEIFTIMDTEEMYMFGSKPSTLETRIEMLEKRILELEKQLQFTNRQTSTAKKDRKKQKQEKLLHTVMEQTGWNYDTAYKAMEHSRVISGAEPKDYVAYRFWELSDDQQKTYFTKDIANALRHKYNTSKENIHCFKNKNEFNAIFKEYIGRPWLHTTTASFEDFRSTMKNEHRIIYKPLSDSCGHGIAVYDLTPDTMDTVYQTLRKLPDGIVEGYVQQHPEMQRFSRNAVNTVRVVTIRVRNQVHILYAAFRMGGGNAVVDNFHAGGVLALIHPESGIIETDAIDLAGHSYKKHPITQETIPGFKIPYWNRTDAPQSGRSCSWHWLCRMGCSGYR